MHKMATAILLGFLLLNVLLFSTACCEKGCPSELKWQKYVRGHVLTPATENEFGVIKVGRNHDEQSVVLYRKSEADSLEIDEVVFFKLYEFNDLPLAKEFNERPANLSDIYGGEVSTRLAYHSFFKHLHPKKKEEGKKGIPIHYKLHLVGGSQIMGSDSTKWTFRSSGNASDFEVLGSGKYWEKFWNVTGDVYVIYEIDENNDKLLKEMSREHNH